MRVEDRRIYTTDFQKRLLDMVVRQRDSGHWALRPGAKDTVCVPSQGTHTLRRAMYAAFLGDVPAGASLKAKCGMRDCLRPTHQAMESGARGAGSRALSVPDVDLCRRAPARRERYQEESLPKGWELSEVLRAKALAGSPLTIAADALGRGSTSYGDIAAIWNGVYDAAIRKARGKVAKRADAAEFAACVDKSAAGELCDDESPEGEWLRRIS